jgi:hypothetical protein
MFIYKSQKVRCKFKIYNKRNVLATQTNLEKI